MRRFELLVLCLCIAGCVLLSGCTEADTGGTPPPTTRVVTTPTQSGGMLVPGPTQTMPLGKEVRVDVLRDTINPTITVTFRGGAGHFQVREMEVTLTRADKTTETQRVSKPNVGTELSFLGTKGKDRIEVYITLITSERFKIIDRLYDFYEHA